MVVHKNNKQIRHLNQDKRIEIYAMLQKGYRYRKIGRLLGYHHTTISREIERNSIDYGRGKTKYKPLEAEKKKTNRRKKADKSRIKLSKNHKLRGIIYYILSSDKNCRGPDEIIGYLRRIGIKTVCTSSLYRYIRNCTDWSKYLRYKQGGYKNKKRKRKKTTTIKNVPKIDKRPEEVNNRNRIGDREIDTIVSKGHIGGLFTSVDRKAKFLCMSKIPNHKSSTLLTIMTYTMKDYIVHTVTSDNGVEFAKLSNLGKRLKAKCFTANPYASYERGTNERTNGLVRRFVPKGTDILSLSDEKILNIQNMLNHKPRKCLDYKTPHEVYYNTTIDYLQV